MLNSQHEKVTRMASKHKKDAFLHLQTRDTSENSNMISSYTQQTSKNQSLTISLLSRKWYIACESGKWYMPFGKQPRSTVAPPFNQGELCCKTLSRHPKPWIVLNSIHTVFFPIHIYIHTYAKV